MQTTEALAGLQCLDCSGGFDPATIRHRCPDCGGVLAPDYDPTALDGAQAELPLAGSGLARYAPVLPLPAERLVGLGEGATPTVACPALAEEWGVEQVVVKNEGRNATGGTVDRGLALAVSVAREHGASDVALPTTGNGGQAAAAYASRAGLDSHAFVPSRATFTNKAMINVHGGDMTVVGGRYPDARSAFEDEIRDTGWYSLAPFETPYRHEGLKTLAYELVADTGGVPDAVVHPTGHGTGLFGLYRGFRELVDTGAVGRMPRLYAAQAGGCAPLATAWADGEAEPDAWEHPDTICGPLEVPDPAGGRYVFDALEATDGAAIGTGDQAILEAAVSLADSGVPASATGGAAVSGGAALSEQGAFEPEDTVVLVDPATANREADLLRSHLMSKGV